MAKKLEVRSERSFGEVLGDGMKVVFRHFKPISTLLLFYAVPFIALALLAILLNGSVSAFLSPNYVSETESVINLIEVYLILGFGLSIAVVMTNLIIYSTVMVYDRNDGQVTTEKVSALFKLHLLNYMGSIGAQIILFGVGIAFVLVTAVLSPVLFGVTYFVMIFVFVWLYIIIQFLGIVRIEEALSIREGIIRCFYLLRNNWWETFGLIMIASLLGSILMYGLLMLFLIVIGLIAAFYSAEGLLNTGIFGIISGGIFAITYTIIMTASYMYLAGVRILKYYDLVEQKEARKLILSIERIGQKNDSLFENIGEY